MLLSRMGGKTFLTKIEIVLISRAMFIGGTVALLASPAWSQEAPGERRPGDNENVPGTRGQGTD